MDDPAGPPEEAGPTQRVTDLVLVGLLLVYTAASISSSGLPGWQVAGGVAVTLVTLVAVPLRRTRPRRALAVLAVTAALGFAVQLPSQALIWAVIAFALTRSPARAVWPLVAGVLGTTVVAAAGYVLIDGGVAAGVGYGLSLGVQLGLFSAIGGVLGVVSRAVRAREETGRRTEERARTAAALAVQRNRIADELGSGVLDGLRRLTGRTAALDPDDADGTGTAAAVAEVEHDARDVLTRMRRALVALREPEPPAPDGPVAGRDAPAPSPWLPTRRGLAVAAVVGLAALGVGLLPLRPIGEPSVDRTVALLDLPWGSPAALASLAVQVLVLAWWRSAPVTAFAVGTVAAIVTGTLGATNGIVEPSWMFLVYGVAVGALPRRSGPVVAVGTLAVLVAYLTVPTMHAQLDADLAGLVLSYLVVPFLWFAGVRRRGHRSHTARLRERRHEVERARELEAERLRVARDLHDVVAHHVSAVAVQAGAGRVTTDPATRREALEHVTESGRRIAAALPEMEGLTPDPGGVALTADGLDDLVAPVRDAGVPVTCEVRGEPAGPRGDPELFAQRILTEALTNVVRHAGHSDTRVVVGHDPDGVRLEVVDDGPVPGHRRWEQGSGLGVVGMRERARVLGGHVDAGPTAGGGWRVSALLPRAGVIREEEPAVTMSSATTTRAVPRPA